MSYLADNMIKVADRYGLSGSVQEGDSVVTFTSDDKSLQIIGRHEIEATLTMTVNGQPFNLEDCAGNFAEHSIEMAVSRLLEGRKVMEECVSALDESGWSVEVVKTDYSNDYVRMTKGSKRAYMYPPLGGRLAVTFGDSIIINGTNRRTAAKDLYNVGFLSSHKQVPGYSGVYPIAK
jgi:hypothetical protein